MLVFLLSCTSFLKRIFLLFFILVLSKYRMLPYSKLVRLYFLYLVLAFRKDFLLFNFFLSILIERYVFSVFKQDNWIMYSPRLFPHSYVLLQVFNCTVIFFVWVWVFIVETWVKYTFWQNNMYNVYVSISLYHNLLWVASGRLKIWMRYNLSSYRASSFTIC